MEDKQYSEFRATCVFCGGFGFGGNDCGGYFQSSGRCYHCDGTGWVYIKEPPMPKESGDSAAQ